jgi:integrase/recombinase XerD
MGLKLTERSGTYYLRGTIRGQSVYETTGTNDKKRAEEIRAKREAQILEDSIHGRAATVTFAEAASSYLASGGSPRFLGKHDATTGKWSGLLGCFGHRKINTITQSELDAAGEKLFPGTKYNTRNRQCHAPFITVWNHAVRNRWAERRDWNRPRKPKGTAAKFLNTKPRAGTLPVSYDYAAKFVMRMSPAPAMLMTVLFYTGMRPIELFVLEDHEVDVAGRWIALSASKTGEPRGIPIHDVLVPLFAGLCERGGFLFRTHRNKPYGLKEDEGGQLKTAINGARARSGIRDISPYTARHTVSTTLVINNVHPYIKDQILGHAVTDVSRNYTKVPQAPLIEAINTLPVVQEWATAPWMSKPLMWTRRLVEGTGKRNDLYPG